MTSKTVTNTRQTKRNTLTCEFVFRLLIAQVLEDLHLAFLFWSREAILGLLLRTFLAMINPYERKRHVRHCPEINSLYHSLTQVNHRWNTKTKAVRNFDQIQLFDIVHILHTMTCIGSNVGFVRLLGAQMQKIVLLD